MTSEQPDEPFDASDSRAVKTARKDARNRALARRETIRGFMSTDKGRAWFYELLSGCSVFGSPWRPEAQVTSFNCGEQNVGLKVLAQIQDAAPDEYLQMIREAKQGKDLEDVEQISDEPKTDGAGS